MQGQRPDGCGASGPISGGSAADERQELVARQGRRHFLLGLSRLGLADLDADSRAAAHRRCPGRCGRGCARAARQRPRPLAAAEPGPAGRGRLAARGNSRPDRHVQPAARPPDLVFAQAVEQWHGHRGDAGAPRSRSHRGGPHDVGGGRQPACRPRRPPWAAAVSRGGRPCWRPRREARVINAPAERLLRPLLRDPGRRT